MGWVKLNTNDVVGNQAATGGLGLLGQMDHWLHDQDRKLQDYGGERLGSNAWFANYMGDRSQEGPIVKR